MYRINKMQTTELLINIITQESISKYNIFYGNTGQKEPAFWNNDSQSHLF